VFKNAWPDRHVGREPLLLTVYSRVCKCYGQLAEGTLWVTGYTVKCAAIEWGATAITTEDP